MGFDGLLSQCGVRREQQIYYIVFAIANTIAANFILPFNDWAHHSPVYLDYDWNIKYVKWWIIDSRK